jgi:hypothetical protein
MRVNIGDLNFQSARSMRVDNNDRLVGSERVPKDTINFSCLLYRFQGDGNNTDIVCVFDFNRNGTIRILAFFSSPLSTLMLFAQETILGTEVMISFS